jgi:hypothetical protein
MMTINVNNLKATVVFRAGELPKINPDAPEFELSLSGVKIAVKINAKTARKLGTWQGGAVLQGKLVAQDGRLILLDAGCQFLDPKPVEPTQ